MCLANIGGVGPRKHPCCSTELQAKFTSGDDCKTGAMAPNWEKMTKIIFRPIKALMQYQTLNRNDVVIGLCLVNIVSANVPFTTDASPSISNRS